MNQKWKELQDGYDPAVHGTVKNYCRELGISYRSFCTYRTFWKRENGIPLQRTKENWDEIIESHDPERESLRQFAFRTGVPYRALISARNRRKNVPVIRKGKSSTEKEKPSIFEGQKPGFFILQLEEEDDLL